MGQLLLQCFSILYLKKDKIYSLICKFCVLFQYLSHKKKLEAEERRVKQKKAREDFRIMLEVSEMFFL